jgi:tetratricopeptide (TPR) repeat protein
MLLLSAQPAFSQSQDCKAADPDKAITGCSADIRRDTPIPANAGMLPVYYNLRALAYEKKDMLQEAQADLDMAVTLKPDFDTYFNRAIFLDDHGGRSPLPDLEQAIAIYEKTAKPPKPWEESYAQANYRRAENLRRDSRAAEALPSYDKAIALRPADMEMAFNRALANSKLEHFDAVIADLTRVIDGNPRRGPFLVSALNNRGLAYMRKGSFKEAVADLDRALATEPGSSLSLVRRGIIHERAGERDKAIADYREALKITASLMDAQEGLRRLGAGP